MKTCPGSLGSVILRGAAAPLQSVRIVPGAENSGGPGCVGRLEGAAGKAAPSPTG